MKKIFLFFLFAGMVQSSDAQILRRIKNRVVSNAESKVENKVENKTVEVINKPIDNVTKPKGKKQKSGEGEPATKKENGIGATAGKDTSGNEIQQKDGYITLRLSAKKVFQGGSVDISGESLAYDKFKEVVLTVKGPSFNETYKVTLAKDDKYAVTWYAYNKKGSYHISVKSSDGKGESSADLEVMERTMIGNMAEENITVVNQAYDKVREKADEVKASISNKDGEQLEQKMKEAESKKDAVIKLYKSLNDANKQVASLARSGSPLPPNLSANLSELNNELNKQSDQVKNAMEFANHQPSENTICEYLVMLNEACAAFSTFTNIWSKSIATIVTNICLDKGVPKATEIVNNAGGNKVMPADYDIALKEPAKIYATSKFDAESLTTKLGTAGLVGDIIQYATSFLLKQYCGTFSGSFKHDFTVTFRNGNGETWWKYNVVVEGTLSLRYPKDRSNGKVIKMKGNIEGNATHFGFITDLNKEDEYKQTTKGNAPIMELRRITPPAIPFASSQHDPLGFGAVARTAVTPACFNITLDADYDKDAGTIKFFVNDALVDFTPAVKNRLVFIQWAAGLPLVRWMEFPIHKSLLTIRSVIRDNNQFGMNADPKGNLQFSGKGTKHLGDGSSAIEQILNFSLSAKKD